MTFSLLKEWILTGLLVAGSHLAPTGELQLGKKIYQDRCKVCHGAKGDVDRFTASVLKPPPRNFTAPESKRELTLERMIRSATEGRPGSAMMAWKNILSEEEIRAVVLYIRTEIMQLK